MKGERGKNAAKKKRWRHALTV